MQLHAWILTLNLITATWLLPGCSLTACVGLIDRRGMWNCGHLWQNFAGKAQCCKLAPLILDLFVAGPCGFASVLLVHNNCSFARLNFHWILDGGTASHLRSLFLIKLALDFGWEDFSSAITAYIECFVWSTLLLIASGSSLPRPNPCINIYSRPIEARPTNQSNLVYFISRRICTKFVMQ